MTSSAIDPPDDNGRDEQRQTRMPRHNVMLTAIVEHFGATPSSRHRVRDLSPRGVRVDQAEGVLRAGSTVLVTVGMLQAVAATVVWTKDGSAGLKFAHDVNPDDARAKAAIAPPHIHRGPPPSSDTAPTAGWMGDMDDAYRR